MSTSKKGHTSCRRVVENQSLPVLLSKIRQRYKMFIVIACNCSIERQFWMITRSGYWFEVLETVFTDKEWIPLLHFLSKSDREIFLATCLLQGLRVCRVEWNYFKCSNRWCWPKWRRLVRKKLVWHGPSFTLQISSKPGRVLGNAYQFHPSSDYLFRRAEQGWNFGSAGIKFGTANTLQNLPEPNFFFFLVCVPFLSELCKKISVM